MTPKEKAKELCNTFLDNAPKYTQGRRDRETAKLNALACVKEIIDFGNGLGLREPMMFWNSVKSEINKL